MAGMTKSQAALAQMVLQELAVAGGQMDESPLKERVSLRRRVERGAGVGLGTWHVLVHRMLEAGTVAERPGSRFGRALAAQLDPAARTRLLAERAAGIERARAAALERNAARSGEVAASWHALAAEATAANERGSGEGLPDFVAFATRQAKRVRFDADALARLEALATP